MGWSGVEGRRRTRELVEDFTRPWQHEGHTRQVTDVRVTCYGRHIWGVVRRNGRPEAIVLRLVRHEAGDTMWKDIDEDCGPYEVDCPLALLAMVPPTGGEYGQQWRERVRQHHARLQDVAQQSRRVRVGSTVHFRDGLRVAGQTLNGMTAEVIGFKGRSPLVIVHNMRVRVSPGHIASVSQEGGAR